MDRHGAAPHLRRRYGDQPDQFGDLHVSHADPELGVVVLFHGGFWRQHRTLSMTTPLAAALAGQGWNVWNVEYRRGRADWRDTLADCTAATDHVARLADELALDTSNVVLAGHSAGGHLASWVACRDASQAGVPVSGLVTLNSVLDLTWAAEAGADAVVEFLGSPPSGDPAAYRLADPTLRLPLQAPARCLHSTEDERVPLQATQRFVTAARAAGGDAVLVAIDGHHTAPLEPGSAAHTAFLREISALRTNRSDTEPAAVTLGRP